MGIRKRPSRVARSRRGAIHLQHDEATTRRCLGRSRARLFSAGYGVNARQPGTTRASARRLVPAVSRISSLLSEPPTAYACLHVTIGCTSFPLADCSATSSKPGVIGVSPFPAARKTRATLLEVRACRPSGKARRARPIRNADCDRARIEQQPVLPHSGVAHHGGAPGFVISVTVFAATSN
jgi:hypothetical protein